MNGWAGQILRVNLSRGTVKREPLDPDMARLYLGGRGIADRIMLNEMKPTADPLGPSNLLIFAAGTLTGTACPCGARYMVVTKGALTGAIASSNSGGYWAPELKFAGYDAIVIDGRAKEPVYLWICDDQVEIRPANHLWGKTVPETDDLVRAETDDEAKVACIGPAGENLSLIAAVMNDKHRAAGRSGVGAVMGSKKLKAIAVRGTKGVTVADPAGFEKAVFGAMKMIFASPMAGQGMPTYGTAMIVDPIQAGGLFPTRNFQSGVFERAYDINGATIRETVLVRVKGCFACPVTCGRATRVTVPGFEGHGEGPEYETCFSLGSDTGVGDIYALTKANYLCNELGLDTISTGATIACAMEMYERGLLPKDKVGMELVFGSGEALVEAVRRIGYREGIGDELAEGSFRFATKYGHPEFSITVKKQEIAAYDPRGAHGMALTYSTSNRGACHLRGWTVGNELMGMEPVLEPYSPVGKAPLCASLQNAMGAIDSSGICSFPTFAITLNELAELVSTATGVKYTPDDLVTVGERVWNMERLFNLAAGFTRADDCIPKRIAEEPLPEGPAKGQTVKTLAVMLDEYYQVRGWDKEGKPTAKKLKELALA